MDLDDLQILLWVSQLGSLNAVSRVHGVPRSTIRRSLERLEATIGHPLVHLDRQGALLTPAGQSLVSKGGDLLSNRTAVVHEARRAASSPLSLKLLFGLGAPPEVTALLLAGLATRLADTRLEVDYAIDPMSRLREPYDAVLYWGDAPRHLEGYTRELLRTELRVQASPMYLERFGVPTDIDDLERHTILHCKGHPRAWPRTSGGLVPIQPAHETNDFYLLGCLAGAGMGLALVPRPELPLAPFVQHLVPVLEDQIQGEASIRFYAPSPTRVNSATEALVRLVEEIGEQLPTGRS